MKASLGDDQGPVPVALADFDQRFDQCFESHVFSPNSDDEDVSLVFGLGHGPAGFRLRVTGVRSNTRSIEKVQQWRCRRWWPGV